MLPSQESTPVISVLSLPLAAQEAMLSDLDKENVRFFHRGDWTELCVTTLGSTHRIPRKEVTLAYFVEALLIDMSMVCV